MDIVTTRQFAKDAEKLDKKSQLQLAEILEQFRRIKNLSELHDLKKMKGFKNAYRLRFGDYRIGFLFEKNEVRLSRVMNRREIYRYFP